MNTPILFTTVKVSHYYKYGLVEFQGVLYKLLRLYHTDKLLREDDIINGYRPGK